MVGWIARITEFFIEEGQRVPKPQENVMTHLQPRTGLIDNPDVIDLKIEATLSGLLTDDDTFRLTLAGRQMFSSQLPQALFSDTITKRMISEFLGDKSEISIIAWMEMFLNFALVDAELFDILNTAELAIIAMAEIHSLRTRTLEMLIGALVLNNAKLYGFVHIDQTTCMITRA